jgi:AcrR family transcriptional regulator
MRKGLKTRQHILSVSQKLFLKKGYSGITVADIANKCGISEPLVYKHFKNKKQLFMECVRTKTPKMVVTFDFETMNTEEFLEAYLEIKAERVFHNQEHYHILFTQAPSFPSLIQQFQNEEFIVNKRPENLELLRRIEKGEISGIFNVYHFEATIALSFWAALKMGEVPGSEQTYHDTQLSLPHLLIKGLINKENADVT